MKYKLEIADCVNKKFRKIKDKKAFSIIKKKINQILKNPYHFKPLKGDLHGSRRVHILKSFVLVYEIDKQNYIIKLLEFEHHDKVY